MGTPPTFVAEYETAFNSNTTPKTASVTVAAGDYLVVVGMSEDAAYTLSTPTGGGLTYTLQQSVVVTDYCTAYIWTAPAPTSQSFTLSVSMSGSSGWWGANCLRFSGSTGIGASSKTNVASGAPSLGLTTSGDNSTIVCASSDWTAADGSSRTWRTVNGFTPSSGGGGEVTYFRDGTHYAAYAAYWPDAGTAGSKTVGISSPSGQKYSIVAVEVLGTSSSETPISVGDAGSAADTLSVTVTASLADAGAAADTLTAAVALALAEAGAAVDIVAVSVPIALTDTGSATEALAVSAAIPLADAGTRSETLLPAVTAALADAGGGAEALLAAVTAALADTGSAADALDNGLGTNKALTDTGSSTEALTVVVTVALGDVAAEAEALTVAAAAALADAAAAAEAITLTAVAPLADAGAAGQAVTAAVTVALGDSGTGADAGSGADSSSTPKSLADGGRATDRIHARVVRPNAGTTTRPSSGITTRPDSGITLWP
jgi:hypothetical protein